MNLIEVITFLVLAGACLFLIWKLDQAYADNDEVVGWWTEAIDALRVSREDADRLGEENRGLRLRLYGETPEERSASIRRLGLALRK